MNRIEKALAYFSGTINYGAMLAMVVCMCVVVANSAKRSLGLGLFPGTFEIVTLIAGVILTLGIPYLTFVKGHVAVGILVDRLAPRKQAVFDVVVYAISLAVAIAITYAMIRLGLRNLESGWHSGVLRVPLFYFNYMMAGSLALTCLVLVKDLAKAVVTLIKGSEVT